MLRPPTSFKSWPDFEEWYEDSATKINGPYRSRVLTYGPEPARLLLLAFQYLGEILEETGEMDASGETGSSESVPLSD